MIVRCFLIVRETVRSADRLIGAEGIYNVVVGTDFPEKLDRLQALLVVDAEAADAAEIGEARIRLRFLDETIWEESIRVGFAPPSGVSLAAPPRFYHVSTFRNVDLAGPGVYWLEFLVSGEVLAATPLGVAEQAGAGVDGLSADEGNTASDTAEIVSRANALLRDPVNLDRLRIREIYLAAPDGDLVVKLIRIDDSVVQARLEIPEWEVRFARDPQGLAREINAALINKPENAIVPTVSDKRFLFLRLMDDLRRRCASQDEYELLGIAGILRLLLWDQYPLVNQINRELKDRINLQFAVGETLMHPMAQPQPESSRLRLVKSGLQLQAVEDRFYPESPQDIRQTVSSERLFRLGVMIVEEHVFTVMDLMKHLAFVGGLLHAGGPKTAKDTTYLAYRGMLPLGGDRPGLLTLRAIGRVIYSGLLPLQGRLMDESVGDKVHESGGAEAGQSE